MSTTFEWTSGGQRQSHTVTKQPGESLSAYWDRAIVEFEEAMVELPPD